MARRGAAAAAARAQPVWPRAGGAAGAAQLCSAWLVLALLACALPAPAGAARLLRQHTDTYTGRGINKDGALKGYAATDHAEAFSQARSLGIEHNEATIRSISAVQYPGPMSKVVTDDVYSEEGAASGMSITAFGPVAATATQGGAEAVAAPQAMQQAARGAAVATTTSSFAPTFTTGVGKMRDVRLSSVGTNLLPSQSFGESEQGDGPYAVAAAGEAVATSISSKTDVPFLIKMGQRR